MTRQLEPIEAPAAPSGGIPPANEISAEVGGAAFSYETGEAGVEVVEANSTSATANVNGYRGDHSQHGRRNRSRGQ
jgi:hypothetical protein